MKRFRFKMRILDAVITQLGATLNRNAQTTAVTFYCCITFFYPVLMVAWIYLLFTPYFIVSLLYLLWFIYDRKNLVQGGRLSWRYRKWSLWRHFRDYFPITMTKTAELDPNRNYIIGYHPHGIMVFGACCCFATEATNFSKVFPGITSHPLILDGYFYTPIIREHCLLIGTCAVNKESIKWLLTKEGKGRAICIAIGGASEALEAHPGRANIILKRRKGFVKLALEHGASLVPAFGFGENDLYNQVTNPENSMLRRIQEKLKKIMGFSLPIFYGQGIFSCFIGFLPYRKPVNVIIGKPIHVEKIENPTEEDISRLHQLYVESLIQLFEDHKSKYARDLTLNIM